jgi:lysophospholipase L1-like esterase
MLKLIRNKPLLFILFVCSLALGFVTIGSALTTDTSSWINSSNLSLQKVANVSPTDIPSTFFAGGNIDCTASSNDRCAVNTSYGLIDNSSLSINGKWIHILDFGGNSANFIAIPDSTTALTTSLGPVFGNYLYFTNDAYSALSPKYKTGTGGTTINGINNLLLDHYQLSRAPDSRLQDKTGTRLAADLNSLAVSGNSEWMVVTDPGITTLRVNVTSGAVLPFGRIFTYGSGLNPRPKNAISSDGRYAVIASQDTSAFSIYDLTTCGATPDSIKSPVACQSRDLFTDNFISHQIPGYSGVQYLRFLDDNTIVFYASYKDGTMTKYAQYVLSTSASLNKQEYLALGDSYISGEGIFDYLEGTDTADNLCHVSLKAYPYLIGKQLNYNSFHSVACSGAITNDILSTISTYAGQVRGGASRSELEKSGAAGSILSNFLPGYIDQLDFVKEYQPKEITLSIGGNDMGFSSMLQQCVEPSSGNTCYSTYEDRLELIRMINTKVFPSLVQTYQKLKAAGPPNMKIYAIGYPQIAKPGGDCALNVRLNNDEIIFSQQIISYLDGIVQQAAAKAGVYYADTQDALNGHRLCEAKPGDVAVNGLTAGNDRPTHWSGPLGDESYHPNALGHILLSSKVLIDTESLSKAMPAPNQAAAPPAESGLEILNAPHSGRAVNNAQYDPGISADLAYRGTPVNVSINGANHSLVSGTAFKAELHSTPISLANFQTSAGGNISVQVIIPSTAPTGYHVLHLYGQDVTGQPVDIYKSIYIANTADDMDGNGIADSAEQCIGFPTSGQDSDKDGIDDACDSNITQPPAQLLQSSEATQVSSDNSSQTTSQTVVPQSDTPKQQDSSSGSMPTQLQSFSSTIDSSNSIVQPAVLAESTTMPEMATQSPVAKNYPKIADNYTVASASALLLSTIGWLLKRKVS